MKNIHQNCNSHKPIDYEVKELDQCYLTIHNFVSFNSKFEIQAKSNSSDSINVKFDNNSQIQSFHTYISSYNKPYLLELVQNANKNCLCCS